MRRKRPRYNPRRFSAMSGLERWEFATRLAEEGFPLSDDERTCFRSAVMGAIEWGISHSKDWEARCYYREMVKREEELTAQQTESRAPETKRHPDVIINI